MAPLFTLEWNWMLSQRMDAFAFFLEYKIEFSFRQKQSIILRRCHLWKEWIDCGVLLEDCLGFLKDGGCKSRRVASCTQFSLWKLFFTLTNFRHLFGTRRHCIASLFRTMEVTFHKIWQWKKRRGHVVGFSFPDMSSFRRESQNNHFSLLEWFSILYYNVCHNHWAYNWFLS